MDVNEHERLSNVTIGHKLKQRNIAFIDVLHFTVTVGSNSCHKMCVKRPQANT